MKRVLSEAEVAAKVIDFLLDDGWEVYQEVPLGNIADIVVKRTTRNGATLLGVIEVKTSVNLTLLSQAEHWLPFANYVWIAFPHRPSTVQSYGIRIAKQKGFGVIKVSTHGSVSEESSPKFARKIRPNLLKALRPEHQDGSHAKAGSVHEPRFTIFRATVIALQELVRKEPGIEMRQAILKLKHHYSRNTSAVANLTKHLRSGVIKGIVERNGDDGKLRLYPIE